MASSRDVEVAFRVDASRWVAGMQKALLAAAEFEAEQARFAAMVGKASDVATAFNVWLGPPPPKTHSGMTARQYRAARRRYARTQRHTRRTR